METKDGLQPGQKRSQKNWAVVGGGILGMAVAKELAKSGATVTLYEAEQELGGLTRAWTIDNIVWDRHYHVILLSDFKTRKMLSMLDLDEETEWVETQTGFYTDGRLHSMSNTFEFLKFPPLNLVDKIRLGGTIFYTSRLEDWKRLEKIPVTDFLRALSGKKTFERIWQPLLRAKLGENYTNVSAAFIWATISRMYKARQSGLKKEMFGYVRGGYDRILDQFDGYLGDLGVKINTGSNVTKIAPRDNEKVLVETSKGKTNFDQVAITIPTPLANKICSTLDDDSNLCLNSVKYQGIICASVLLKKPLSSYYITNITDPSIPFTAVIEISSLVAKEQFGGHALVYLPKYVTSEDAYFEKCDEELETEWLAALSKMHPTFDSKDLVAFKISRERYVHALPTLNYSEELPPMKLPMPGVHLVNSSYIVQGTTNVNETLALAETWAESTLAATSV